MRLYRLVNGHGQWFRSNKFNGFYESEASARRASKLARGYYMKDTNWHIETAEVEWYELVGQPESVSVRSEFPVDGDSE